MNETTKKVGLIALIIAAVIAAGFGAKTFFAGEQMEVQNTIKMPPGYKSEKQQALDQQKSGTPQQPTRDVDLSGDLGGSGK